MATKKKSTKGQFNARLSPPIQEYIAKAAKAAGMTQAEFIEQCVLRHTDQVFASSDEERKQLRADLAKLKEDAKLNK